MTRVAASLRHVTGRLDDAEAALLRNEERLDVEREAVEPGRPEDLRGRRAREELEAALCIGEAPDRQDAGQAVEEPADKLPIARLMDLDARPGQRPRADSDVKALVEQREQARKLLDRRRKVGVGHKSTRARAPPAFRVGPRSPCRD